MAVIVGRKLFCAVRTAQQNMIIFKNVRDGEKDMRFFFVRKAQNEVFQRNLPFKNFLSILTQCPFTVT